MAADILKKIHWLGHDGFRIDATKVVYIDPYHAPAGLPKADLILITHEHHDHYSPADVEALRQPTTSFVTIAKVAAALKGDVHVVKPGDRVIVQGVEIEATPAYNVNKRFHRKTDEYVGFIVTVDGKRIYHAGDTDVIPEMATFRADVALLPVSGTYVMTADEAIEAARLIQPALAIPMHYGAIVGGLADAQKFAAGAPGETVILQIEA
jgi:L-ascorbate metabolism protein UlaG (beta-lactamase superfamily)